MLAVIGGVFDHDPEQSALAYQHLFDRLSKIANESCITSFTFLLLLSCGHVSGNADNKHALISGKQIAFSRDKGNCLACHVIEDGEFPGNIGPELKALTSRFKNKQELREQIWDATRNNPETSMPPFGKNKILSEELKSTKLVDYLWGIK